MLLNAKFCARSLGKFLKSQIDSRKRRIYVNVRGSTPPADLQTVDLQLADVLLRGQTRADADQLTSGPEADDGVRDGVLQRGRYRLRRHML